MRKHTPKRLLAQKSFIGSKVLSYSDNVEERARSAAAADGSSSRRGCASVRAGTPAKGMQLRRMTAFLAALIFFFFFGALVPVQARDDGRYANEPLRAWFDHLASGRGACCSFADGFSIQDVDWDSQDGKYRVRLYGEWIIVPDNAVVTEPNKFGPAVVWPYMDAQGVTQIRCFLPGAGT